MTTRDPLDLTDGGRLRRLEALDELLPAITGVLDVREVFERISEISSRVLPHDMMGLPIVEPDGAHVRVYAVTGRTFRTPMLVPLADSQRELTTKAWEHIVVDDLLDDPDERTQPPAQAGYRSTLRLPIRLQGRFVGVLDFMSMTPHFYTAADAPIGRRIADHVALVLSHQRLAEQAQRAEALRERAATLSMLDELLGTLSGVLDIREVFDRIHEIARQVLRQDAMAIMFPTEDRKRLRVHALRGFGEDLTAATETRLRDADAEVLTGTLDYRLIDDLSVIPEYADTRAVKIGLNSALVMPVNLEGQAHAFVSFFARPKAHFTQDDVPIGRRISDHIALALSHERLAVEASRNEALRAREANLEMLDELLAAVTDSGELTDLFDRISAIAKRVLPHDAMSLPVLMEDGRRARMYALTGFTPGVQPEVMPVPENILRGEVEHELIGELSETPGAHNQRGASLGFRSALRVIFKLNGKLAGGLVFLSKSPHAFAPADVHVARRIADRVAIRLAQEGRLEASKRADEATARAAKLEARVRALTDELDARTGYRRVVGDSREWREVLTQAAKVATTEATVLLLGESGTGKEVVARFLHRASERKNGPFVALNCAALPDHLLEAELFGYERGAFTGAVQTKPGQLELASGGTLLLDEVGEMSLAAQAKFLRVLQEREFQRLGGTRVLRTDARIVAATNRDLQQAIAKGTFREDLFYRLNVFAIQLPSLRARRADILPLSEAFLIEIGRGIGRPPAGISRDARKLLTEYDWPGNVRELRNILERAAILCDGGLITSEHLALAPPLRPRAPEPVVPQAVGASAGKTAPPAPPAGDIQSVERAMIEQALANARFNKSKAAKELGITRTQLYVRMRKYGLS